MEYKEQPLAATLAKVSANQIIELFVALAKDKKLDHKWRFMYGKAVLENENDRLLVETKIKYKVSKKKIEKQAEEFLPEETTTVSDTEKKRIQKRFVL
jgi:hypothetical protein